ncbi:hypothetical protein CLOSYM_03760 [[Clostridium] symbiosum ATCC 14940]|uniref:Uncharacterized protein n=1 Tax=[Clostridium] symbiosum ATCC 14940 TaxID=411472 RepID=A0ABC9TTY5_CLOSY|nr:hypothetical protein CLOSYM_03760 [[Clostridium] symbiosum ATCC 14940]
MPEQSCFKKQREHLAEYIMAELFPELRQMRYLRLDKKAASMYT